MSTVLRIYKGKEIIMEELLERLASLRKECREEFEEDNGVDFSETYDWDDDPSFYAGLDRGIELCLDLIKEIHTNV